MLGSGLLRDGTSTEKESRQRCSGDAGAAFLRKNRRGDDLAGYMYVPQTKATGWALRV